MTKYCRRLLEVEAIQATKDNLEELRKFSKADVRRVELTYGKVFCYYQIPGLFRVIYKGQWLIKRPDGYLEVMTNSEFKREYEPK